MDRRSIEASARREDDFFRLFASIGMVGAVVMMAGARGARKGRVSRLDVSNDHTRESVGFPISDLDLEIDMEMYLQI